MTSSFFSFSRRSLRQIYVIIFFSVDLWMMERRKNKIESRPCEEWCFEMFLYLFYFCHFHYCSSLFRRYMWQQWQFISPFFFLKTHSMVGTRHIEKCFRNLTWKTAHMFQLKSEAEWREMRWRRQCDSNRTTAKKEKKRERKREKKERTHTEQEKNKWQSKEIELICH